MHFRQLLDRTLSKVALPFPQVDPDWVVSGSLRSTGILEPWDAVHAVSGFPGGLDRFHTTCVPSFSGCPNPAQFRLAPGESSGVVVLFEVP